MISAAISSCFPVCNTHHTPKQNALKITMIALQVLLILSGLASYFSGGGLGLSMVSFTAALAIEVQSFLYKQYLNTGKVCFFDTSKPKEHVLTPEELLGQFYLGSKELMRRMETPVFKSLVEKGIVHFSSSDKPGVVLETSDFVPPKTDETVSYTNFWKGSDDVEQKMCSVITDWLYLSASPQNASEVPSFLEILYSSPIPPVIFMTTNCVENRETATTICQRYWPSSFERKKGENKEFGDFTVSVAEEELEESLCTRSIIITKKSISSSSPALQHYQFKLWPHDKALIGFESFDEALSTALADIEKGNPVLVHDEGKGRSAAFVASLLIRYLHETAKRNNVSAAVKLNEMVEHLRQHGRQGFLDEKQHYETVVGYASYLRNLAT